MEQKGDEIIVKELHTTSSHLLMWNIYTDNIKLKWIHIQKRAQLKAPARSTKNMEKIS